MANEMYRKTSLQPPWQLHFSILATNKDIILRINYTIATIEQHTKNLSEHIITPWQLPLNIPATTKQHLVFHNTQTTT